MKGLLLINLGTPKNPSPESVGDFLTEFLSDKRVIDRPLLLRWVLVNKIIVPNRKKESAKAYKAIWTSKGSPLMFHSEALRSKLAQKLSDDFVVELSMRYGEPSITNQWKNLLKHNLEAIYILPLYPQSTMSSTASALDKVNEFIKKEKPSIPVYFLENFYDKDFYIQSYADICRQSMLEHESDHLLISFHGIPVRHIKKEKSYQKPCSVDPNCCDKIDEKNSFCYRAQCFCTANKLALAAGCKNKYSVGFQSRLGRAPWTKPYIGEVVQELVEKGVQRLTVVCPSFVTDCLETLEEIQIRLKKDFIVMGGKDLQAVPCLNDSEQWVESLAKEFKKLPNSSLNWLNHR